jgi:hypothetical protein
MNIDYLLEFIKITIISLEQDLDGIAEEMILLDPASKDYTELDIEHTYISGQIMGMRYILSQTQEG